MRGWYRWTERRRRVDVCDGWFFNFGEISPWIYRHDGRLIERASTSIRKINIVPRRWLFRDVSRYIKLKEDTGELMTAATSSSDRVGIYGLSYVTWLIRGFIRKYSAPARKDRRILDKTLRHILIRQLSAVFVFAAQFAGFGPWRFPLLPKLSR